MTFNGLCISFDIFILYRLRNKFLQHITISLDSASWELHQYLRRLCKTMTSTKDDRSRYSISGPHDLIGRHSISVPRKPHTFFAENDLTCKNEDLSTCI